MSNWNDCRAQQNGCADPGKSGLAMANLLGWQQAQQRTVPKFSILEPPREALLAEIAGLKARAERAEKGRWANRIFVGGVALLALSYAAGVILDMWLVFHG